METIIGISADDYFSCGCPYCNGNYASQKLIDNGSSELICTECGEKFIIFNLGINQTSVKLPTGELDADGQMLFDYILKEAHPRADVPFHSFEDEDFKPVLGGEYCQLFDEGVCDEETNYMFYSYITKSEQAAKRIKGIIDNVPEEDRIFSCEIDYGFDIPFMSRIVIYFNVVDYERADLLKKLISKNDTISSTIIRKAIYSFKGKRLNMGVKEVI